LTAGFREDVVAGLSATPKSIPSKYFYDRRGSKLFGRICELPEYYPTRTEISILEERGEEIAAAVGPGREVVELGSGNSRKTLLLLDLLESPGGYVPVDISDAALRAAARRLAEVHPEIPVRPVHGDFLDSVDLPPPEAGRRLVYFPGSTIGNFAPPVALGLLRRMADAAGPGGGLLIGIDLKKDRAVLEAAYDDAQGVTAEFNRNLLVRMRDELGADVPLDAFGHRAFYDADAGRIEMHLVNVPGAPIRLDGREFPFRPGETIHTENSHKYDPREFADFAAGAGFRHVATWTDAKDWFGVQLYERGRV